MNSLKIEELKRQAWLHDKEAGRGHFILRQILRSLLLWLGVAIVLPLADKSLSWREISVGVAFIPVFILGGYLEGKWRWKDMVNKYRE